MCVCVCANVCVCERENVCAHVLVSLKVLWALMRWGAINNITIFNYQSNGWGGWVGGLI